MPKHTLKLLVLLSALSVAPASAGQWNSSAAAFGDDTGCPYERARLAAAWEAEHQGETTITLTDRVPADSSLFDFSRGTSLPTP